MFHRTVTTRRPRSTLVTAMLAAATAGALLAAPAKAQLIPKTNLGGGALTGQVVFDQGYELPPAGAPCEETRWKFTGGSPVVNGVPVPATIALNTVLTGYVGPISVTATGGAQCENGDGGLAKITSVIATGVGPTGSKIDCPVPGYPPLEGTAERTGSTVVIDVDGSCRINSFGIASVRFVSTGEFIPTDASGTPAVGPGVTGPVSKASYTGIFVVATL